MEGDLTEGFLRYEFRGLIHMEELVFGILRYVPLNRIWFWSGHTILDRKLCELINDKRSTFVVPTLFFRKQPTFRGASNLVPRSPTAKGNLQNRVRSGYEIRGNHLAGKPEVASRNENV